MSGGEPAKLLWLAASSVVELDVDKRRVGR
jgi:hypothetical protein